MIQTGHSRTPIAPMAEIVVEVVVETAEVEAMLAKGVLVAEEEGLETVVEGQEALEEGLEAMREGQVVMEEEQEAVKGLEEVG